MVTEEPEWTQSLQTPIMDSHLHTSPEISRRINDAADQLFAENGQAAFPNVDAVRRRARANMNDVSIVMRDWRRRHSAPVEAVEDALPATLRDAGTQLLNSFWHEASVLANTHLQEAQAIWDRERAELDEMRDQLAAAFDVQSQELAASQNDVADLTQRAQLAIESQEGLAQRARAAEAKAESSAEVLSLAQTQLQEMTRLLHAANANQERLSEQLATLQSANVRAAELRQEQQARLTEQLSEARQEIASLKAVAAANKTNSRKAVRPPRTVAADGAAKGKFTSTTSEKGKKS